MFYSNTKISASRQNRIVTHVGGVSIEFDVGDINSILGTEDEGLELYTFSKELKFNHFLHVNTIKNICRHSNLSDDVCSIPFHKQLVLV